VGANSNATQIPPKQPARGGQRKGQQNAVAEFDPNLSQHERDEKNQILSNQQIVEKILQIQKMALENAQFYLQLTYCDTTFCHRFVHFEVDIDYIEQFEPILNEYIDALKSQEHEGILHYHLQEMPTKAQLASLDPHDNLLLAATKPKKKAKAKKKNVPVVKDLFGDIMEEESQMMGDEPDEDEDDHEDDSDSPAKQDDAFYPGDDIVGKLYGSR